MRRRSTRATDRGRHLVATRRTLALVIAVALLAAGCVSDGSDAPLDSSATTAGAPAQSSTTLLAEPSTETTTTTQVPPPDTRPTPLVVRRIVVTGPEEIVFDWTTDRCENEHIPDIAPRAFRDADGMVQLNIGHYVNYRMTGPDLDTLTSDCTAPVLSSDFDPDPDQFNDSEWIGAVYTEDGETVYAVVHNEYRGVTHQSARPGQCPSNDNLACLDTSFTMAISTDGGDTFSDIATPPNHLIATMPYVFDDEGVPSGIRQPSNIVRGPDDYFYLFGNVSDYPTTAGAFEPQWVCAMRTDDLSDPASWRYWDGEAFAGQFVNPYLGSSATGADAPKCAPVSLPELSASVNEGLVYNEALSKFVMVGISVQPDAGAPTWGVYYSLSDDLIHWSPRELLIEIASGEAVVDSANDLLHAYPSIIDTDSTSMSFETTDDKAYLYVSRFNFGGNSLDRDLVRFPIAVRDVVYGGPEWTFDSDGDTEGWATESGIGSLDVASGTMTLTTLDDDPSTMSGPVTVPASFDTMVISMRLPEGSDTIGQVFFLTDNAPNWSEANSVVFDVIADGEFHEYALDLSGLPGWSGIVKRLRLDPVAAAGLTVDIDYITFPG
jgi:hypothetical protein